MHWLWRRTGFAALATIALLGGGWCSVAPALARFEAGALLRGLGLVLSVAVGVLAGSAARSGDAAGRAALRGGRRVLLATLPATVALAATIAPSSSLLTVVSFAIAGCAVALTGALGAGLGAFVDEPKAFGPGTIGIAELALPPALVTGAAGVLFCAAFAVTRGIAGGTLFIVAALAACGGGWWVARWASRSLSNVVSEAAAGRASGPGPGTEHNAGSDDAGSVRSLGAAIEALRRRLAAEHEAGTAPPPPPTEHERQTEDFLAIISAELRAPLEDIASTAALLVAGGRLSAAQQEDVALILAGSGELLGLVEMVLEQPAPESRPRLDLSLVDLEALAREVVSGQRSIWADKGLGVAVNAEAELPAVTGDPRRLKQVLTNLVGNAVKFTRAGEVAVSLATDGDDVLVVVRDEGPGIPAESLRRLFNAYEQAGDAGEKAQGSGLGLAICKRLVEAHGGSIGVESTVGVGSIFRVRLPRVGPSLGASPAGVLPLLSQPALAPSAGVMDAGGDLDRSGEPRA